MAIKWGGGERLKRVAAQPCQQAGAITDEAPAGGSDRLVGQIHVSLASPGPQAASAG
jgi:hypothetical protein